MENIDQMQRLIGTTGRKEFVQFAREYANNSHKVTMESDITGEDILPKYCKIHLQQVEYKSIIGLIEDFEGTIIKMQRGEAISKANKDTAKK